MFYVFCFKHPTHRQGARECAHKAHNVQEAEGGHLVLEEVGDQLEQAAQLQAGQAG
jgi:hypothetical protein